MQRIIFACAIAVAGASSTRAASGDVFPRPDANSAQAETIIDNSLRIASAEKNRIESRGEFADSLTGGPDSWEVAGAGPAGLSLRAEASQHADPVAHFPNGTVLKNLGCKIRHGTRWCKVERADAPSARGWVNGRYLREAAGAK